MCVHYVVPDGEIGPELIAGVGDEIVLRIGDHVVSKDVLAQVDVPVTTEIAAADERMRRLGQAVRYDLSPDEAHPAGLVRVDAAVGWLVVARR